MPAAHQQLFFCFDGVQIIVADSSDASVGKLLFSLRKAGTVDEFRNLILYSLDGGIKSK
jgi:uncharacterized protein (DUF2235 family)